ncbi:hypothetical protein GJAV_G00037190 [Gymnothorax javanicus]|nr:hypothetical protein GJAV_G00037190 [Gymnothorax javanicus]
MGSSRAFVFYFSFTFFTMLLSNACLGIPVSWIATILGSTISEVTSDSSTSSPSTAIMGAGDLIQPIDPETEADSSASSPSTAIMGAGDLIQPIDPETEAELLQSAIFVTQGDVLAQLERNVVGAVWNGEPGSVSVPYVVGEDLVHRTEDILSAFKMLSTKTCVSFHQRSQELDYLYFTMGYGCASYLGRRGGKQPIYIGDRCQVGNIIHELMHALGFHHEHMRIDRDDHVTIIRKNIIPEKKRNFAKVNGDTLGLPYDTGSIMHYGPRFFSWNGKNTIESKSGEPIGQRIGLSVLDIRRVHLLYKCDTRSAETTLSSTTTRQPTTVSLGTNMTSVPVTVQSTTSSASARTEAAPTSTRTEAAPTSTRTEAAPTSPRTESAPTSTRTEAPPKALAPKLPQQALAPKLPQQALAPKLPQQAPALKLPQQALAPKLPQQALTPNLPQKALTPKLPQQALTRRLPQQALSLQLHLSP